MAFQRYSKELNRQFLSGAIRHPEVLALCPNVTDKDFDPEANRIVYSALRACLASGGAFSEHVLIDRLNSLGIKIGGSIEPGLYVQNLVGQGVNANAAVAIAEQIKGITLRRELHEATERMRQIIEDDAAAKDRLKAVELVAAVTKAYNEKVNLLGNTGSQEPVDLFGTIQSFLCRDNSISAKAIATPFPILNDLYGYMDVGSVYLIASRMKIGKSSWWLSMAKQLADADKDDNLRILVLDTELEAWENHSRLLASVSGVSEFRIRQGYYKDRPRELRAVEEAAEYIAGLEGRTHHVYCGGMSLEEILSVARRWAFKNLLDGKRGLIVYDYIKLNSGADFASTQSLFIRIGEKMDAMKKLSKELHVPVLCFAQTNRENVETKAGAAQSGSAVIGGSDMLAQFASNIYLLEELTEEEKHMLNQLGPDGATHSLKEIACRQRGPCELGEDKRVKVATTDRQGKTRDRWMRNYLLYQFKSFAVSEIGSISTIIKRNAALGFQMQPVDETKHDLL